MGQRECRLVDFFLDYERRLNQALRTPQHPAIAALQAVFGRRFLQITSQGDIDLTHNDARLTWHLQSGLHTRRRLGAFAVRLERVAVDVLDGGFGLARVRWTHHFGRASMADTAQAVEALYFTHTDASGASQIYACMTGTAAVPLTVRHAPPPRVLVARRPTPAGPCRTEAVTS